jgi:hypothetical protein
MTEWKRSLGLTKKHFIIFALVAVAAFSGVYAFTSSAWCYGGTLMGRPCYTGYFSGTYDQWGDNVLPEIKNGQALPSTDVYNATTFYNFLRAAYFSGNAQRQTGAAFIYHTLEGDQGPAVGNAGRSISEAQWQLLFAKLDALDKAGKITWHGNVSADTNSYWQGPNTNDDAYYGEFKNESGILIRNFDDSVLYRLLRRCANPIGSSPGLPDLQYTLDPHVTNVTPSQVEPGSKMNVQSNVTNAGPAVSRPTQWEITQITVQPGRKAPHEDDGTTFSGTAPCQSGGGGPNGNYFQNADASCKNIKRDSGVFPANTTYLPDEGNLETPDVPVGTRICYALSVQPRANDDDRWAHSKPICTIVGKRPKVQIWGDDVAVRGRIETSRVTKNIDGSQKVFGSWVEYGAFSTGVNSLFASGSGLADQTNIDQSAWSRLTFANENGSGAPAYGEYAPATPADSFRSLPAVASFFAGLQNKQPVNSNNVSALSFLNSEPTIVRTAGNLTLVGAEMAANHSTVILATGTVTIDDSIRYTDAAIDDVRKIPQVVIIAKDIIIKGSVERVDAWLVASDSINTCYDFTGNLTSGKCATKLEVNGPVITNKLLLNRTAGSETGPQSGDPAERFNLRPDAHIWARLRSEGSSKAQTVYSVELPPRF